MEEVYDGGGGTRGVEHEGLGQKSAHRSVSGI